MAETAMWGLWGCDGELFVLCIRPGEKDLIRRGDNDPKADGHIALSVGHTDLTCQLILGRCSHSKTLSSPAFQIEDDMIALRK